MIARYNFLLWFLVGPFVANGQILYDVFSNERLECVHPVMDTMVKHKFLPSEMDVSWLSIVNDKNQKNYVSKKTKELCLSYILEEKRLNALMEEGNNRKESFLDISKDKRYSYYDYERTGVNKSNMLYPYLREISCKAYSLTNRVMYFAVEFDFTTGNQSEYRTSDFVVRHHYTIDVDTGTISRFDPTYSTAQMNALKEFCAARMTEEYMLVTNKMSLFDIYRLQGVLKRYGYYTDGPPPVTSSSEFVRDFNWDELKVYWFNWGVIAEFEEYSATSKVLDGSGFRIFMELDEAKKVLGKIPAFSYINALNLRPDRLINGTGTPDALNSKSIRLTGDIQSLIQLNKVEKRNLQAQQMDYVIAEKNERKIRRTTIVSYDSLGRLARYENLNAYNALENLVTYSYDEQGRLAFSYKHNNQNKKPEIVTSYYYDTKGNLKLKYEDAGSNSKKIFYACNGDYASQFQIAFIDNKIPDITVYEITPEYIQTARIRQSLNEFGELAIGATYTKSGQPSEIFSDNERGKEYYDYDQQGRLVRQCKIWDQELSFLYKFKYDSTALLPVLVTRTDIRSGSDKFVSYLECKYTYQQSKE